MPSAGRSRGGGGGATYAAPNYESRASFDLPPAPSGTEKPGDVSKDGVETASTGKIHQVRPPGSSCTVSPFILAENVSHSHEHSDD